jgi:hypothetical protein
MIRLLLFLGLFISTNTIAQLTGFTLTGNPENVNGATCTYKNQDSLMYSRTKTFFNQYICNLTTGLTNNSFEKSEVNIYPNPTNSYIQENLEDSFEIQIFNLTGKLLLSKAVSQNEKIDISHFTNGIYLSKI